MPWIATVPGFSPVTPRPALKWFAKAPPLDLIGLTDRVTLVLTRNLSDSLGLTDAAQSARLLGLSDAVGLTDSVTSTLFTASFLSPTDPLGLTDDVAAVIVIPTAVPLADTVGLTDGAVAQFVQTTDAVAFDTLGLADAISVVSDTVRTYETLSSRRLNLTDQLTYQLVIVPDSTDTRDAAGLTDAVTKVLTAVMVIRGHHRGFGKGRL